MSVHGDLALALAALGGLMTGALGLAILARSRLRRAAPSPVPPSAPGRDQSGAAGPVAAERALLAEACADIADRLRDQQPALYGVLTRNLEEAGITMNSPNGEPFDARRHNPVGTEPTSDPASDLHVAATTRLGYLDHGQLIRSPDVIVYRLAGTSHAP